MKGRHIIGLSILVIVSCIGLRKSCAMLSTDHNLIFCIDDHITAQEKHIIIDFVCTLHEQNKSQGSTLTLIQQQFPYIESINTVRLPNHMLQYTIHATKPHCIVNQEYVFTSNNQLTNKHIFISKTTDELPALHIDQAALQEKQHLVNFQECITALPDTLFTDYHITWFNPMRIQLQDKHQPQFSILCSTDRIPDNRVLTACNFIKQDLTKTNQLINTAFAKNGKKNQSNTRNWAADIRFNNQIVLYAKKGDSEHG